MQWREGREILSTSSFVPGEAFLGIPPLTIFSMESEQCLPVSLKFSSFVQSTQGLLVWLLSRSMAVFSGPYPIQAFQPLILQSLSVLVTKTHEIQPFSLSYPVALGLVLSSVCFSLSNLSPQWEFPSFCSIHDLFLFQTTCMHFLPSSVWPLISLQLFGLFCQ